jgi:hypothetical protein
MLVPMGLWIAGTMQERAIKKIVLRIDDDYNKSAERAQVKPRSWVSCLKRNFADESLCPPVKTRFTL